MSDGPRNEVMFDRIRDFIIAATQSDRALTTEWRAALHDVALELDEIAYGRDAHPDSVAHAQQAMSALSGAWLDDDEKEDLYLGASDNAAKE